MANCAYPELPYDPVVAKRVGQNAELTEIACKYLEDTGDDSLRAQIPSLGLNLPPNMKAAINLLEDTNKTRVLDNTLDHAKNLYRAQEKDNLEKSAESAKRLRTYLQPPPKRAGDQELVMTFLMANLAVRVVRSRQQNHSKEFRIMGREVPHLETVISLQLEALKDHSDWSHEGFFVRGLLSCLKKKRNVRLQDSDDENTPGVQPMQKKRRSEVGGTSTQIVSANARKETDGQVDVALSYEAATQGSVELHGQGEEQNSSSTSRRAIRTEQKWIAVPCTTCEKDIPYDPHKQSQECVACRRKARALSVVDQQAPTPTAVMVVAPAAVMVAPTAVMVPPRFAPTAVMVAPAPPTTPVSPIEHSAIERASHETTSRDFAPTYEQALQLQSIQVQQSDKSRNEALEQIIGNMSDFLAEQEVEKQGLKSMLEEERREFTRQNRGLKTMLEEERREFTRQERGFLAAHDEIVRLEARIQQLEEQR